MFKRYVVETLAYLSADLLLAAVITIATVIVVTFIGWVVFVGRSVGAEFDADWERTEILIEAQERGESTEEIEDIWK